MGFEETAVLGGSFMSHQHPHFLASAIAYFKTTHVQALISHHYHPKLTSSDDNFEFGQVSKIRLSFAIRDKVLILLKPLATHSENRNGGRRRPL
jgi:hypothetical protein